MNNISFTSGIKPVLMNDFFKYKSAISVDNYVDYPWLISSSKVASDVYTSNICDCTSCLITDGKKALLMHLNSYSKNNHDFRNVLKYISNNMNISDNNLQAVLVGSKSSYALSAKIFKKFTLLLNHLKIPVTILKNGMGPTNIAYRTCKDEVVVSNITIEKALNKGQTGIRALESGFEEVKISDLDYVI